MTTRNSYTTGLFDALVGLAQALRPDWDAPGIRAAIRSAYGRPEQPSVPALVYAVARIAADPTIATPTVLGMDGPHWQPRPLDEKPTPRPPRRDEACPDHPGQWRSNCHSCAADQLGGAR